MFSRNSGFVRGTVAVVAGAHLAACATRPADIPPRYVSPLIFAQATCPQLLDESSTLSLRLDPLGNRISRNATIDAIWVGAYVPLLVLLPFTFFLLHGNGAEYEEYSALLGQRDAVQQQLRSKQCNRIAGDDPGKRRGRLGNNAPALNDADQDHDDGDDQQYVNESTHGVRGQQPQAPKDQQQNCNGFQHVLGTPFSCMTAKRG